MLLFLTDTCPCQEHGRGKADVPGRNNVPGRTNRAINQLSRQYSKSKAIKTYFLVFLTFIIREICYDFSSNRTIRPPQIKKWDRP